MRSISYRSLMGLDGLKWYVTQAEDEEAEQEGEPVWLIFVFHEYGNFPAKSMSITPEIFEAFLQWVTARPNTLVSVNDVIGSVVQPIFTDIAEPLYTGQPFVSFTFDDGTSDHKDVGNLFKEHDMQATFLVSSDHS